MVAVVLNDHGGGKEKSAAQIFAIKINPDNDAPTITGIEKQTANEDVAEIAADFKVNDVDNNISLLSITVKSTNETLVPYTNMVISGSGKDRTIKLYPVADAFGEADITITVSDGVATAETTFTVVVNSVNDLPTITSIAGQTIPEDGSSGALEFTVTDKETAVEVTASSSDTTLFPEGAIILGGSGNERTITLKPAGEASGSATITVTAADTDGEAR